VPALRLRTLARGSPGALNGVIRATFVEQRLAIDIIAGPPLYLLADPDQLDQLLIKLVKNAVDSSLERGGTVKIHWSIADDVLKLCVDDEGEGIAEATNLFVPFFTTKAAARGLVSL
jgi:two-component system, NtrC family, nitrogen regulation sensor histidine kinase NtrY